MENYISGILLQFVVRKHTASLCGIFDVDLTFVLSVITELELNYK